MGHAFCLRRQGGKPGGSLRGARLAQSLPIARTPLPQRRSQGRLSQYGSSGGGGGERRHGNDCEIDWAEGEEGVCGCCCGGGGGYLEGEGDTAQFVWHGEGSDDEDDEEEEGVASDVDIEDAEGEEDEGEEGIIEVEEDDDVLGDDDVLDNLSPYIAGDDVGESDDDVDLEVTRPSTARRITAINSPDKFNRAEGKSPTSADNLSGAGASDGVEEVVASVEEDVKVECAEAEVVGLPVLERRADGFVATNSTQSTDVTMRRCCSWLHAQRNQTTCCPNTGVSGAQSTMRPMDKPRSIFTFASSPVLRASRSPRSTTLSSPNSAVAPGSPGAVGEGAAWASSTPRSVKGGLMKHVGSSGSPLGSPGDSERGGGRLLSRCKSAGRLAVERAEKERGKERESEKDRQFVKEQGRSPLSSEQVPMAPGDGGSASSAISKGSDNESLRPTLVLEEGGGGGVDSKSAEDEECEPYELFEDRVRFLVCAQNMHM